MTWEYVRSRVKNRPEDRRTELMPHVCILMRKTQSTTTQPKPPSGGSSATRACCWSAAATGSLYSSMVSLSLRSGESSCADMIKSCNWWRLEWLRRSPGKTCFPWVNIDGSRSVARVSVLLSHRDKVRESVKHLTTRAAVDKRSDKRWSGETVRLRASSGREPLNRGGLGLAERANSERCSFLVFDDGFAERGKGRQVSQVDMSTRARRGSMWFSRWRMDAVR